MDCREKTGFEIKSIEKAALSGFEGVGMAAKQYDPCLSMTIPFLSCAPSCDSSNISSYGSGSSSTSTTTD